MADTYDYEGDDLAPPAAGAEPPDLQAWRDQAPPEFGEIADRMAARLNDYVQRRDLADASRAAGNAFVGQLESITRDFSAMVSADPAAFDTARGLARDATALLVGTVPGVDPEQIEGHHDAITRDIDRELARSAVNSLARRDATAARSMLEQARQYLPDNEVQALDGFIGVMDRARAIDGAAAQAAAEQQRIEREDDTAWNYLAALTTPTGDVSFKPGWAQRVLSDPNLPPDASAALIETQGRLIESGDASTSDPFLARDLIGATMPEILSHAGEGLRLSDALTLAGLAKDPARQNAVGAALAEAERQIARPENGPAGDVAFERFVNWFLPLVRQGAALDPRSPDYLLAGNRMQAFAPRASDYAARISIPSGARPSLSEIFGGSRG